MIIEVFTSNSHKTRLGYFVAYISKEFNEMVVENHGKVIKYEIKQYVYHQGMEAPFITVKDIKEALTCVPEFKYLS